MKIFKPGLSDIPQILQLLQKQYDYHHDLDPTYYVPNSENLDKKFEEYLTDAIIKDDPNILVAEEGDETIGFITFEEQSEQYFDTNIKNYGVVLELFVNEDQRTRGVGTKLMSEAENYFKAKGLKYMKLSCSTFNKLALNFYVNGKYVSRQFLMFKEL
jgi:ribosomal protein S18 acetylase RimI-like enzyme